MLPEASIDAIESLDDGTSLFYAMYLLRIMTKLKNDGQDIFDTLPNGKKRYFKDLLTHKDFLSKSESKMYVTAVSSLDRTDRPVACTIVFAV